MSAALRARREPVARRDPAPASAPTDRAADHDSDRHADRRADRHACRFACCLAGRPVTAIDLLSADPRPEDAS